MGKASAPKVARGWILGFYIPFLGAFLWAAWRRLPAFDATLTTAFILLIVSPFVAPMTTTLSPDKVSQITLTGRRHLYWRDVTRVTLGDRGSVLLEGNRGTRIRINPMFYANFDETRLWLAERLPNLWPRDMR